MKPSLTSLCLIALALPAQAVEYQRVLQEQSRIEFSTAQMGVEVPGYFRRFRVELSFDPARPAKARAKIEIDMASVETGSRLDTEAVRGADWFDVAHFPHARFESNSLRWLGQDRYELTGRLTLRGQNRTVKTRLSIKPQAGQALFAGQFQLKRLDYGIGESVWGDTGVVANPVRIRFHLLADTAASQ